MTYSILLRGSDLLNGKSIVEQAVAREVLAHVLLDEIDTEIRVVDALDLVANTADYKVKITSVPAPAKDQNDTTYSAY